MGLLLAGARLRSEDLPTWAPFVERDFPFYSSVLDTRTNLGQGVTNSLTPRGLVLHLDADVHVCFDLDLVRIAAIWLGPGVTPVSMSQGSYRNDLWGKKAPEGQELLPQILGKPWLITGPLPEIQSLPTNTAPIRWVDSRKPGPDAREVGKGPLPVGQARFKAIDFRGSEATLEYQCEDAIIRERFLIERPRPLDGPESANSILLHQLSISPHTNRLVVTPGDLLTQVPASGPFFDGSVPVNASGMEETFRLRLQAFQESSLRPKKIPTADPRWPQRVHTAVKQTATNDAFRIEHIALPTDNPWRRNVRLADIAFFSDGRAAAVTFDGDIWIIEGLEGDLKDVTWRRFTSGLHEPLSLAIRNDEIFVYDRNGIWRILDRNDDGEADRHELFCNDFAQTAETREFASSMKLCPDGSFVIGKPGQSGSTVGRDAGKVLRISPSGKTVTTLGHGFRQPFLGVNPQTGLVTVSDQQGNYVPTTPLYTLGAGDEDHGFRAVFLPKETEIPTLAQPLVWIPHSINASAAGQVWLQENMGPLSHTLLLLGYYRSEIFNVLWNNSPNATAAVVSFTRDLRFAPLNASIHPKDNSLFVTGFQIWGATAPEISGLARITYTGAPSSIPQEIQAMREGVLLRFATPIAANSIKPENFSAERWNYQRSREYGSPHFKLDGSKGQETLFASSAYLSKDRRAVFIGVPDMRAVMTLRVGWSLHGENQLPLEQNAYLTPRQLESFIPGKHGFAPIQIDLTPRTVANISDQTPITAGEGKRLADLMGCAACHSADGSTLGKVGPTWKGLAGSRVKFTDGSSAVADDTYLRESIQNPSVKIVKDFDKSDAGMPSYEGILTDAQIQALIAYIRSLK